MCGYFGKLTFICDKEPTSISEHMLRQLVVKELQLTLAGIQLSTHE